MGIGCVFTPVLVGVAAGGGTPTTPQCPLTKVSSGNTNAWVAPALATVLNQVIASLNSQGITLAFTSSFRTAAGQSAAANSGGPSAATAAAPGQSWHEVGLAVDVKLNRLPNGEVNLNDPTNIAIIGAMTSYGLTWGGPLTDKNGNPTPDYVHFQLPPPSINNGTLYRLGAPDPIQVENCRREHPNGP